jgi:hypothetical protein
MIPGVWQQQLSHSRRSIVKDRRPDPHDERPLIDYDPPTRRERSARHKTRSRPDEYERRRRLAARASPRQEPDWDDDDLGEDDDDLGAWIADEILGDDDEPES